MVSGALLMIGLEATSVTEVNLLCATMCYLKVVI